jgi:dihydroflavonol-4-reductase
VLPSWLIRLGAISNPMMKAVAPLLDVNMNASSAKAKQLLGWEPRSAEEAIVASAESLLRLGLVSHA